MQAGVAVVREWELVRHEGHDCPSTGNGVVVLTDVPDGQDFYRSVIERELPGDHPSLRVEHNQTWLELFA